MASVRNFVLVVAGVGVGRYAAIVDPTYFSLLSAVGGGVIGAFVNQAFTHARTRTDREEAARVVQRDAAGDLLTAADHFSWELVLSRSGGAVSGVAVPSSLDPQVISLTAALRRLDAEIRRAHVVITDLEARAIVVKLHAALENLYDQQRREPRLGSEEWAITVKAVLDSHTDQLQAVSERNLRLGGPDRRPLIRWNGRTPRHAAGGE